MIESPDHQGSPVSTDVISALIALARISGAAPLGTVAAQLAGLARSSVPAVAVGLAVVQDSRVVHLEISGGALAFVLDERQYPAGFGPCLDAARSGRTVVIEDTNAGKYAQYRQLIQRHGVRQVVSVPLLPATAGPAIGSLAFYGADVRRPQGTPSDDLVNLFASLASVVLGDALRYRAAVVTVQQMEQALHSRAVIEQAKGMIMYNLRCSADEAFERLRLRSSTSGHKVRDVAVMIVDQATPGSLSSRSARE
jgi:GAF domain-containing protein